MPLISSAVNVAVGRFGIRYYKETHKDVEIFYSDLGKGANLELGIGNLE